MGQPVELVVAEHTEEVVVERPSVVALEGPAVVGDPFVVEAHFVGLVASCLVAI